MTTAARTVALLALFDKEQKEDIYGISEQVRNVALYFMMDVDPNLTTEEFAAALSERGISYGTAKARLNDVRRFMTL